MMKKYLNSKGQLNPAVMVIASVAITFVVISVLMGVGADVQQDLYAQSIANTTTGPRNITGIFTNATPSFSLAGQFLEFDSVNVYNATSLVLVDNANYTLGRNPPTIIWVNASTICAGGCYNGTNVLIRFIYLNTTVSAQAAAYSNGTVAIANMSQYMGTLGLVFAAGAVLTLLAAAFVFVRRE